MQTHVARWQSVGNGAAELKRKKAPPRHLGRRGFLPWRSRKAWGLHSRSGVVWHRASVDCADYRILVGPLFTVSRT